MEEAFQFGSARAPAAQKPLRALASTWFSWVLVLSTTGANRRAPSHLCGGHIECDLTSVYKNHACTRSGGRVGGQQLCLKDRCRYVHFEVYGLWCVRLWFHQPDQAFHHIEIAQVSLREATGGVSLEINGYMRRNDADDAR